MKSETSKTPSGVTTILTREEEAYAVIENRSPKEMERIDIDFTEHVIRIYSDTPWPIEDYMRSGAPRTPSG